MPVAARHTAIYLRVSSRSQDLRLQERELEQWRSREPDCPVDWYRDTASGASMDRPEWARLERALRAGQVERIVVWRLDRLGRKVEALARLLEELRTLHAGLVSLRDGFDLGTPVGRLLLHILASVAEYEREVTLERQAAGIAAARAAGVRWGGSQKGRRLKVRPEVERELLRMAAEGRPVAAISRLLGISRQQIYRELDRADALTPRERRLAQRAAQGRTLAAATATVRRAPEIADTGKVVVR